MRPAGSRMMLRALTSRWIEPVRVDGGERAADVLDDDRRLAIAQLARARRRARPSSRRDRNSITSPSRPSCCLDVRARARRWGAAAARAHGPRAAGAPSAGRRCTARCRILSATAHLEHRIPGAIDAPEPAAADLLFEHDSGPTPSACRPPCRPGRVASGFANAPRRDSPTAAWRAPAQSRRAVAAATPRAVNRPTRRWSTCSSDISAVQSTGSPIGDVAPAGAGRASRQTWRASSARRLTARCTATRAAPADGFPR